MLYDEFRKLFVRFNKRHYGMRPMIEQVHKRNLLNNPLVGVEVGVAVGLNAFSILSHLNIGKLFLVDSYRQCPGNMFFAVKRLRPFVDTTVFYNMDSLDAVKLVVDGSLDFVYLDGSHEYGDVRDDIVAWYPKVKLGGVFGGHDFKTGRMGLCKAVYEFAFKEGLEVVGGGIDWWYKQ